MTTTRKPLTDCFPAVLCSTCAFYDPNYVADDGLSEGKCRFLSPVVSSSPGETSGGLSPVGEWPNVYADDWCGQWKHSNRKPQ